MVRLASEPTPERALSITWTGTDRAAREIVAWARNADGNTRFQPPAVGSDQPARVLVERDHPFSAEWVTCPVGSTVHRESTADDARLTVEPPPAAPADPLETFAGHRGSDGVGWPT